MINIVSFRPNARFSAIYNGSGKGAGVHFRSNDSLIAIAGLGTQTKFTAWIEDLRVDKFDEKTEREACKLYSEGS